MILKNITVIKNYGDLIIGKRDRSPFYYCRFYVGKKITSNGYYFQSLKTKSLYDARKLAKDVWKKYQSGAVDMITPNEKKLSYFAELFLENKKRRLNAGEITDKKSLAVDRNRIERTMYDFFGKDRDVTTIEYKDINKYLYDYLDYIKGKTKLNYKVLLHGVLKFAVINNTLSSMPIFPKLSKGTPDSYVPYTDKEIQMIKTEIRRRMKSTFKVDERNYLLYRELNNLIDFTRFAPLRPGLEIMKLQHEHIGEIITMSGLKGLSIRPPTRKVKKNMGIAIGRPILREIYLNDICKRYPNVTGQEYLFYNYDDMRVKIDMDSMVKKISNIFKKVVLALDLYKTVYGVRPMYSLRSTQFMDDKKQGLPEEELAKNSNTSKEMLDSHYLVTYSETEQEDLLEKLYGKDKRNPKNQK